MGLVGALIFPNELLADVVCFKAMKKGLLLVKTDRESVKLGPPLCISQDAILEGLEILEEVIAEIAKKKINT